MFYHDHSWGITRLNVYAGEAAGYMITDPVEQKLIADGVIPSDQIPLIIQDKTFVPSAEQLYGDPAAGIYGQDPTWDGARWGTEGDLWYHHVYMPAQNPGDPSGMSGFGRWITAHGSGRPPRTRSTDRSTTRTSTRPATSMIRRPGRIRRIRSASRRSFRVRRTSLPVWSSSTTPRW
jgi:hypothetical protein